MNLVRRLFPFRTCTIDIKDGERALQRPCLLYHIKRCQGPCIEAIDEGRPTGPTSPRSSSSSRVARSPLADALRHEMTAGVGADATTRRAATMRDKIRAIERTMESQKMAAFAKHGARSRGPGPAGQPGGGPAVRHPRRQDCSGGTCSCSTSPRDATRRRGARPASCASTTAGRRASRARSPCRAPWPMPTDLERVPDGPSRGNGP